MSVIQFCCCVDIFVIILIAHIFQKDLLFLISIRHCSHHFGVFLSLLGLMSMGRAIQITCWCFHSVQSLKHLFQVPSCTSLQAILYSGHIQHHPIPFQNWEALPQQSPRDDQSPPERTLESRDVVLVVLGCSWTTHFVRLLYVFGVFSTPILLSDFYILYKYTPICISFRCVRVIVSFVLSFFNFSWGRA